MQRSHSGQKSQDTYLYRYLVQHQISLSGEPRSGKERARDAQQGRTRMSHDCCSGRRNAIYTCCHTYMHVATYAVNAMYAVYAMHATPYVRSYVYLPLCIGRGARRGKEGSLLTCLVWRAYAMHAMHYIGRPASTMRR